MKKYILVMSLIFCIICIGVAQDSVLADTKVFTVGVDNTGYYPMYEFKNGEYTGFARDVLDSFAKDSGYSFKFKVFPVLRLYLNFLKTDKIDFKYPDNTFWKADLKKGKKISYSIPVIGYIDGVMVLPKNKGRGLTGSFRLGTVLGFTPWEYLDHVNTGKVIVDAAPTYGATIKKTLYGRVDGAYSCIVVLKYQLKQMNKPEALVFDH